MTLTMPVQVDILICLLAVQEVHPSISIRSFLNQYRQAGRYPVEQFDDILIAHPHTAV